jgi:hypothetical protein
MNTIDPTLEQFEAMLAEERAGFAAWHAAEAAHGELSQQYREASDRRFAATKAIQEARPTDPAVLARQTRWLLHVFEDCAPNDDPRRQPARGVGGAAGNGEPGQAAQLEVLTGAAGTPRAVARPPPFHLLQARLGPSPRAASF